MNLKKILDFEKSFAERVRERCGLSLEKVERVLGWLKDLNWKDGDFKVLKSPSSDFYQDIRDKAVSVVAALTPVVDSYLDPDDIEAIVWAVLLENSSRGGLFN